MCWIWRPKASKRGFASVPDGHRGSVKSTEISGCLCLFVCLFFNFSLFLRIALFWVDFIHKETFPMSGPGPDDTSNSSNWWAPWWKKSSFPSPSKSPVSFLSPFGSRGRSSVWSGWRQCGVWGVCPRTGHAEKHAQTGPQPPRTPRLAVTMGARRDLSRYLLGFPRFNFVGAKELWKYVLLNDHDDFENKDKDEHALSPGV